MGYHDQLKQLDKRGWNLRNKEICEYCGLQMDLSTVKVDLVQLLK